MRRQLGGEHASVNADDALYIPVMLLLLVDDATSEKRRKEGGQQWN